MMNVFEFVLLILVICFAYKAFETYLKNRAANQETSQADDVQDRFQELEERIKVLERIVTDDRYDLKKEFRDLGK